MFYIQANSWCVSCDRASGWVEIGPRCLPNFCFISIGSRFNWHAFDAGAAIALLTLCFYIYIHFIEGTTVVSYQRFYRNAARKLMWPICVCRVGLPHYWRTLFCLLNRSLEIFGHCVTQSISFSLFLSMLGDIISIVQSNIFQLKASQYRIAIQVTCSLRFNRTI